MNVNVHGLIIRPGDSLLLVAEGSMSDAELETLRTEIRSRLPGIDKICVFEHITAMAVYRPDETARP